MYVVSKLANFSEWEFCYWFAWKQRLKLKKNREAEVPAFIKEQQIKIKCAKTLFAKPFQM